LVVVELPSPVTAIDPAVDVPVSVFVLRVAIVYPMKVLLGRLLRTYQAFHLHLVLDLLF
jgi:hypothetical protein